MNFLLDRKLILGMCAFCIVGQLSGEPPAHSRSVSLIAIIANPQNYTGKEVVVRGYIAYQREVRALFVSTDAVKEGNLKDSLWIDDFELQQSDRLKLEKLDGKVTYATVKGVIDGASLGPNSLYSGELKLTAIHTLKDQ